MKPSTSEKRARVLQAVRGPCESLTTPEIAEAVGLGTLDTRHQLVALMAAGHVRRSRYRVDPEPRPQWHWFAVSQNER